jgi:hypothetical protein
MQLSYNLGISSLRRRGGAAPGFPLDAIGRSAVDIHYGFRRVFTAYTGPVVRLIRLSDSAQADFGAVPVGSGEEALALTSVASNATIGNGQTLAVWASGTACFAVTSYDHSGNGRHATQGTAANQPRVVTAAGALETRPSGPGLAMFNTAVTFTGGTEGWLQPPAFTSGTVTNAASVLHAAWSVIASQPAAGAYNTGSPTWWAFGGNDYYPSLYEPNRPNAGSLGSNWMINRLVSWYESVETGAQNGYIRAAPVSSPIDVAAWNFAGHRSTPTVVAGVLNFTPTNRWYGRTNAAQFVGWVGEQTVLKRLLTVGERDAIQLEQMASW